MTLKSTCPLFWGQECPHGERWVHSIAQLAGGMHGDGVAWLVPGVLQRVRPREHIAQQGWHAGGGRSQPWHMFTACEPHLPLWRPSVSKVRAEQGRGRQLARPRKPAESATGSGPGVGPRRTAPPGQFCCQALVLRSLRCVGGKASASHNRPGSSGPCPAVWQAGEDTLVP